MGFPSISKWPFILLLIQVLLFHDQNYGIHYEYTVPVNYTAENQSEPEKPQDSLFIWTHSGWEGCSVQCGGGEELGSRTRWVWVLLKEGVNSGHFAASAQDMEGLAT